MVKCGLGPIFCIRMTVDTRTGFTSGSYWTAIGPDGYNGRINQCRFGNFAVMAWRVVGRVTGTAFKDGCMFVNIYFPAFSVRMTVDAGAGVVAAWIFLPVTGVAFGNGRMVKCQWRPTINRVAVDTFTGKMIRIIVDRCSFVAACAVSVGVGVTAVFVTL